MSLDQFMRVIRSPKEGYQWLQQNGQLCIKMNNKKKKVATHLRLLPPLWLLLLQLLRLR